MALRQCPCPPGESKEHLRTNPTTGKHIKMCFDHALQHDNGKSFPLYRPNPEFNR